METGKIFGWSIASVLILLLVCVLGMVGCPAYNVYQQTKQGEAEYERAKQNRQITVEEAKADNEASISRAEAKIKMAKAENQSRIILAQGEAQAEIERAKGIAEANKIIGASLKGNNEYLKYLMIDAIAHGNGERIYIPTEAGLPILEAK